MGRESDFDLVVVGGGINGAGIARDAAGRGLRVLLCEQDDLASHTSSASTKLIHGGLRYLEHYEFRLVGKALVEREVLLRAAPHIIRPLRFVVPYFKGLRPAWFIRLGLFLYDHLDFGKRQLLPGSCGIRVAGHPAGAVLDGQFTRGFEYSDARVDDARLVVLNAVDAAQRGATVLTRTACTGARIDGERWVMDLADAGGGGLRQVRTRALVNATGPWVSEFLDHTLRIGARRHIRRVKGSHIVVPRLFDHDFAYLFQNPDGRVVFAIPYQGRYTLIGTTDVEWHGNPAQAAISDDEVAYLCTAVNRYFTVHIGPPDVVWSFAGVRPLVEDEKSSASAVTRDYVLEMQDNGAPLLSVFGGKITTYRKLAEDVVARLAPRLGEIGRPWTASARLPGGDIGGARFDDFLQQCAEHYPWLPAELRERLASAYGTRIARILGDARGLADLGEAIGDGLYEGELRYLVDHEWARTSEDILWRRTKLGLRALPETRARLDAWLGAYSVPRVAIG